MKYNLPEYEPSENVWQNIEAKLNADAFQKLSTYEPSEMIWYQIEEELEPKPTKMLVLRWISVAATVAIIAGFYFWMQPTNEKIVFSEQTIDKNLLLNPADDSQKQFDMIMAYCKTETLACENPSFKSLKTELEELNMASIQLKSAIGKYNTEPELMAQLTVIEQQKTEIMKQMAAIM